MQIVILAGGLAKRLGEKTLQTPKAMLLIEGKPFMQYQVELLVSRGVKDFVLCTGHLGEQIENYFGDGSRFGVRIRYSRETGKLLGTGGALKNAEALLGDTFMVMYGDSYLRLDYEDVWRRQQADALDGLMVVYRNDNQFDRSNLTVENGFVTEYSYEGPRPKRYIDYGLSVLRKAFLQDFSGGSAFGLQEIFQRLIAARRLRAYEAAERFFEIGSHGGIENFKELVKRERL